LIGSALLITVFGLAGIWSTGLAKSDFSNFYKQLIFFVVGLAFMLIISFFDYRILRNNSYLILAAYFFCLALLAGLHFFAPVIRGTHGWYKVGFLTLDPIELMKIVLIIVVLICLGILMVSGIKLKHFTIMTICFLLVAGFSWQFLLKDYQKGRISAFLFPQDILGGSWSQTQTKISVGSGGIFGEGLGKGSEVQYGFLPEPHTDFIFSVIAEEWGLVGMLVFFGAYAIFLWRILRIALMSSSNFPRLFAVGFAIMLIAQFAINIGMNLSLLPVVGIYLPLVSYGGSGLIANFASIGILQSIYGRK
jgi:rod shape determining protein RodA